MLGGNEDCVQSDPISLKWFISFSDYHTSFIHSVNFGNTAVDINPDLSHLQIELANYYLAIGERKKAENQIKTCLGFDNSYRHCKEYNDTLFNEGVIQEIGFQDKELEKYYNSS